MACLNACSSSFTWQYRVVKSVAGDLSERARTCVDLRVRLTLFVTDRGYISSRGDAPRSPMPKMLEGTQSFGAAGRVASTTSQPQHAQCHTQRWQRTDIIQPQPHAFRDHASAHMAQSQHWQVGVVFQPQSGGVASPWKSKNTIKPIFQFPENHKLN